MPRTHTPIHIKRFKDGRCLPIEIEPEDRSWILYVDDHGRPSLWLDFPDAIPVEENDPSKGFFEHAYMPAQMAYDAEPERMTEYERTCIEACKLSPEDEIKFLKKKIEELSKS